jgi:hypothetical protein
MTYAEFWYADIRLFEVYRNAYLRDVSYRAWQNGNYFFDAISKAIYNGFGRKSGENAKQYVSWKDPVEKLAPKLSKEESELQFRQQEAALNDWLFGRRD